MNRDQEKDLSQNPPFPQFNYHPDPLKTGSIKKSDECCVCCNQKRGYIYTGPVYSLEDLDDSLCPWCIADGSAAAKFDADFCSPLALYNDKVAKSIIDEVQYRTPSYISWQDCNWAAHCEDACEYHGLVDAKYLNSLNEEQKDFLLQELGWDEGMWDQLIENIPTDESVVDDPEIHLFLCRHCKKELYDIAYS